MKQYDVIENGKIVQSLSENQIDSNFKTQGLANGSVVERDATYDEELAECYRQRRAAYPSVGDQLDAAYHARQGDATQQQAIDAQITAVKSQFPKPTPPAAPAPTDSTGSTSASTTTSTDSSTPTAPAAS